MRPVDQSTAGQPTDEQVTAPAVPKGLDATLVLVRHGESTWVAERRFQGQADPPLSETGRREARLAATRLARPLASPSLPVPEGPPMEIAFSPLARAADTAFEIQRAVAAPEGFGIEVPMRPDTGLLETAQGDWEGLTHDDIASRWPDILATWRRRPLEAWAPGGESLDQVAARVRRSLGTTLEMLADGRNPGTLDRPQVPGYRERVTAGPWTILVAHDGVFKVLLLTLFELPLERFWLFPFALAGISVVEFRGGRATLRAHNLTEHLAPLLDERARELAEERERAGAL